MAAKCKYCNIVELDFEKLADGSWKRTEKGTGTLHTPDRCKELKANPSLLSKLIAPNTTTTTTPIITESKSTASGFPKEINSSAPITTTEIRTVMEDILKREQKIEDNIIIIKESLEVLMRAQMGQPVEPKALDKVTS